MEKGYPSAPPVSAFAVLPAGPASLIVGGTLREGPEPVNSGKWPIWGIFAVFVDISQTMATHSGGKLVFAARMPQVQPLIGSKWQVKWRKSFGSWVILNPLRPVLISASSANVSMM